MITEAKKRSIIKMRVKLDKPEAAWNTGQLLTDFLKIHNFPIYHLPSLMTN